MNKIKVKKKSMNYNMKEKISYTVYKLFSSNVNKYTVFILLYLNFYIYEFSF